MTKHERLHDYAAGQGITVCPAHFSEIKKAACLQTAADCKNILLDTANIDTQAEANELLAEELGHYETGGLFRLSPLHNGSLERSNRGRYEASARRWAYLTLLPPSEIERAIEYCTDIYELAEHLDVPQAFLVKTVEYYAGEGITFRWPDYEA
ncbi:MAG: hypothetical protein FWE62_02830 [Firmicutes bacterium]|nr:hypothetical protein [Bacillota bacterium]